MFYRYKNKFINLHKFASVELIQNIINQNKYTIELISPSYFGKNIILKFNSEMSAMIEFNKISKLIEKKIK